MPATRHCSTAPASCRLFIFAIIRHAALFYLSLSHSTRLRDAERAHAFSIVLLPPAVTYLAAALHALLFHRHHLALNAPCQPLTCLPTVRLMRQDARLRLRLTPALCLRHCR